MCKTFKEGIGRGKDQRCGKCWSGEEQGDDTLQGRKDKMFQSAQVLG